MPDIVIGDHPHPPILDYDLADPTVACSHPGPVVTRVNKESGNEITDQVSVRDDDLVLVAPTCRTQKAGESSRGLLLPGPQVFVGYILGRVGTWKCAFSKNTPLRIRDTIMIFADDLGGFDRTDQVTGIDSSYWQRTKSLRG